jgi:hypothetical protein
MVRRPLCIAALAFLMHAHVSVAPALAIPPGYFVDSTQAFEPRPIRQDYDDGDFTLAIRREFADSTEARLLGIAEATYPPRDDLIMLSVVHRTEIGPDTTRVPMWWYDGVGVHRVPYAVTAGALDYYVKLTDRSRSHNFWGAFARSLFWTDLNYKASVSHHEEYYAGAERYEDVYVAEITLAWGYDEGTFVPISRAHRIVILNRDGKVLMVDGDGAVQESVWFSVHRGPGFVQRLMR